MSNKKRKENKKLIDANLELVKRFLMDVIDHPQKIEKIPSGSTIVLYPVK